ncbi:MAG: beta-lactamase family protein [Acidimicrobiales bacterium]|nr:beta-lactamase family protein [Acidimicrobiales bacterium]MCB9395023.1 beta-lactamase family protein [Acidimicrobiaceae bacterium]
MTSARAARPTGMTELDDDALAQLDAAVAGQVLDRTPGAVWAVATDDRTHVGAAGRLDAGGRPMRRDSIVRIASMTKPLTALAALMLVDEGRIGLDDPVDPWLPELADRRVLVPGATTLDQTVPAERPITVRDLLTFRMGLGYDFSGRSAQLTLGPLAAAGLVLGPPTPSTMPTADRLMAIVGSVPLEHQPGSGWRYHLSAEVLGVLVERVTTERLGDVFQERITGPLGMHDTAFAVEPHRLDRFGDCWGSDPSTGVLAVWDTADGHWAGDPPLHSGGGGLVSTVDDVLRFGRCLLDGAVAPDGALLMSPALVREMTTDQLTSEQRLDLDPEGREGWGFGVGVQVGTDDPTAPAGSYGWTGGLGTVWRNDPARRVTVVVLTNQMFTDPSLPLAIADGLRLAFAAVR